MDSIEILNKLVPTNPNAAPFLTLDDAKKLVAHVIDHCRPQFPHQQRECEWMTIGQIKKYFGVSHSVAKNLCNTKGVRRSLGFSKWTHYNVSDCERVFAGESLCDNA